MTTRITARDLAGMVGHWLGCPVNGYLGSDYGTDLKALLQTPLAAGLADGLIAKARQDIALLAASPPDTVNVYAAQTALDEQTIYFEVAGELVAVNDGTSSSASFQQTSPLQIASDAPAAAPAPADDDIF
jgi:hypothetical protein